MKTYYIEDDVSRSGFTIEILTQSGHNVEHASNYEDALSLLENQPFDLYLLDGQFPRSKNDEPEYLALELIDEIKHRDPEAKIIVSSHYTDNKREVEKKGAEFKPKEDLEWLMEI